jgi:hypothetical protein
LEYVFEVSAEEASSEGFRDLDVEEAGFILNEDDLTEAETVEDEAFAYEVRTAPDSNRESAIGRKRALGGQVGKKRSRGSKEK